MGQVENANQKNSTKLSKGITIARLRAPGWPALEKIFHHATIVKGHRRKIIATMSNSGIPNLPPITVTSVANRV
jgi:hypothetical protein